MKEFVLGQGPGHKLEMAISRNDGDATHIEWLSSGENFKSVMLLTEGKAELVLKKAEIIPGYFRDLNLAAVIPATTGMASIADEEELFASYIDPDFKNWGLNVRGKARPETFVKSLELVRNGNFKELFSSLGDLDKLVMTDDQIVWVKRNRPDLLVQNGNANLFLKKKGKEFFVAGVSRYSGGFMVDVRRLSDGIIWLAGFGHRVVVPQLLARP